MYLVLSLCSLPTLVFAAKPDGTGGGKGGKGGNGGSTASYDLACGTTNNTVTTSQAILLIGGSEAGASGEIEATQWLLNFAQGGDYLVIRAGGTGSQAAWVCDTFSSSIGSAAELSIDSTSQANDSSTVEIIQSAEVLFIAGGDQNIYEDNWKDTAVNTAINNHITAGKPIAGTSAGLAILGSSYYAPNGASVLTSELLSNPYGDNANDINHGDFINHPVLTNLITDSHLNREHGSNNENRYGRVFGFLARSVADTGNSSARAIGIENATFVAISPNGNAQVFGEGDAFFLQANSYPEQISSGSELIWNNAGNATDVYKITGSLNGSGSFNLNNWSGSGGVSLNWFTTGGENGFNCLGGC